MSIPYEKSKCLGGVFFRIFSATLGVCALTIILGGSLAYSILERDLKRNTENILDFSASLVADCVNSGVPTEKIRNAAQSFSKESGVRTTLVKADGTVVFDTGADADKMPNHFGRAEIKAALSGRKTFAERYSQTLFKKMIYIAAPAGAKTADGSEFCVRQSIPADTLAKSRKILAIDCAAISVFAIFTAGVFSWLMAKKISSPLKRLTWLSVQYAHGNLDAPQVRSSIGEIQTLSASLSGMARNLKKRMKSLRKRNCELDEIFGQMSECVFICTQDGRIKRFNTAFARRFGIPESADNPRADESIRNSALLESIDRTFASRQTLTREVDFPDGETYALIGTPLPYNSQNARALFVMRNVSPEKRAERLRREFVSGASHELKTPITSIKMCAETLAELDVSQDAKRFAKMINAQSDRMANLVNDMLLLSRIEFTEEYAKKSFENFDAKTLLEEAAANHSHQADAMGDKIEISCPETLQIFGDRTLALIALSNLVDNAVKYGGQNCKISISAWSANGKTAVSVRDSGAGIAQENLGRVFERFFRVDKGRSRALGGTGLGLAIVKHVAIMHGGEATVKSTPAKGSEFSITFAAQS